MYLQEQYEEQNKGLPTRFSLSESGSFVLIGGKDKVDDNMGMLLAFIGWFRLYTQDYVINVYQFLQNTTSYLFQFKNILRLKILEVGRKYVPFANIYSADIPINYEDRKSVGIYVQFKYKLKNVEDYQVIKRIVI